MRNLQALDPMEQGQRGRAGHASAEAGELRAFTKVGIPAAAVNVSQALAGQSEGPGRAGEVAERAK